MLDPIRAALADISRQYHDIRKQRCQIEAVSLEQSNCRLSGNVLDKATLDSVTADLAVRFPRLTFDTSDVQILRQTNPKQLVVSTNVTGLHAEPNFRSEMMDQLLAGAIVEQLEVAGNWVFARLPDGYLGWIYKNYLKSAVPFESTHYLCGPTGLLRVSPDDEAPISGRIMVGTAVCASISKDGYQFVTTASEMEGWLPANYLRAQETLPNLADGQQAVRVRDQMVRDSRRFAGVPYIWGGTTASGFDCSGFARLIHKLSGILIPRDADMQYAAGKPVEPPFQPGDLLFFGSASGHRSISHVGMSIGGWRIIHSSRPNNGVYEDDVENTSWLNDIFVGAKNFIL